MIADLEAYLDKYVSRLNPHDREELANNLALSIAEAARIDPKTAVTRYDKGGDAGDDGSPFWLQAYRWRGSWSARAPDSKLWVRADLLPETVCKQLQPKSKYPWTPEEADHIARGIDYRRAVEADPKRKQKIDGYLAEVNAEAQKIDVENAEFCSMYALHEDPYGLYGLPFELSTGVAKRNFVRRLPDGFWVMGEDLPADMALKLYRRKD
jgi:hypothetical protein